MREGGGVKLWLCAAALNFAAPAAAEPAIDAALETIRASALSRDTSAAAPLFAADLAMISQSGKLYGRADALSDLGGGFEAWDNSEVVTRRAGGMATVTLVNTRKRPKLEPARFRVLQVWRKHGKAWLLTAQSSVRIAQ